MKKPGIGFMAAHFPALSRARELTQSSGCSRMGLGLEVRSLFAKCLPGTPEPSWETYILRSGGPCKLYGTYMIIFYNRKSTF